MTDHSPAPFDPNNDASSAGMPRRPTIEYPCDWAYRVIGPTERGVRAAIAEAVGDLEHRVAFSRESRSGRYCALRLELRVENEAQRNRIFQGLQSHAEVRFVL